ncbi:RedY protein [Spartinivicinus poritis]|uniref:RedY protein n=1 Tax=Spartinivicinus poritis TaxID=2994640 RepID=A0ABT5U577_9GAMM|nr:RedY protein [Spartinivicinus sp. A2-2]MDE1461512.1 RedY protein [Spartinivicinus sp. A2-2]
MLIIHKIKLKEKVSALDFENWVKEKDYLACESLDGVVRFAVHSVQDKSENFDYVETIFVNDITVFEQDMNKPIFKSLEKDFYAMAEVVEEIELNTISPGYNWF